MRRPDQPASLLYRIIRPVARALFRVLVGWQVEGLHRVPLEGAVILVANHVSWLDPPLLGMLLPRPVYFMAKRELFRPRWFAFLLRLVGAYPVQRGAADRAAIRRSLSLLAQGHMVSVFPEGHRSSTGKLGPLQGGAALLAQYSGAWILPMGISPRYGLLRPVKLRIGQPFRVRPEDDRRAITESILSAIQKLIPDESPASKGSG